MKDIPSNSQVTDAAISEFHLADRRAIFVPEDIVTIPGADGMEAQGVVGCAVRVMHPHAVGDDSQLL